MRRVALVVGVLVVAAAGSWVLWPRDTPSPTRPDAELLEPLGPAPRPPVVAEPGGAVLRAPPPPREEGRSLDRASLLAERNRLARVHRDLVARSQAGTISQQEVERAEVDLLDARRALDEIDEATWHRARVELLDREARRMDLYVAAGVVAPIDAQRARLALERERRLAGDASDYAAERAAFLDVLAKRGAALVEAGLTMEAAVRAEREAAEKEFPP